MILSLPVHCINIAFTMTKQIDSSRIINVLFFLFFFAKHHPGLLAPPQNCVPLKFKNAIISNDRLSLDYNE